MYDRLSFNNAFKTALAAGERQVGCWLTTGSAAATEIAAGAGFDWLLIDMEHAANDLTEIVDHLRAANGGSAEPVVRVPWNDPVLVKRLLDQGARSLMFPNIQTLEEAAAAVAATRYPPAGIRGLAGTSRATDYGRRKDYATRCEEELCVIVQLETGGAIDAANHIAAVAGIDGVFIGPNNLAANLGSLGALDADPVVQAIDRAHAAIRAARKAGGILDFRPHGAFLRFKAGFCFVAVCGDAHTLAGSLSTLAQKSRDWIS